MNLKAFLSEMAAEARDEFARNCATTRGHLQNVMYGMRPCAPELAVQVERMSAGAVRRWDMRPDDWHRIWPELIGTDGAPEVPAEAKAA